MRYSEKSLIGYQGNLNAHWDNPHPRTAVNGAGVVAPPC